MSSNGREKMVKATLREEWKKSRQVQANGKLSKGTPTDNSQSLHTRTTYQTNKIINSPEIMMINLQLVERRENKVQESINNKIGQ